MKSRDDIPHGYWLVMPLATVVCLIGVILFYPAWGFNHINADELGVVENAQVILLIGAICFGARILLMPGQRPHRWITAWVWLITIACLYAAGEETSWGQHYFRWATPEWLKRINSQGETNFHNSSEIFNAIPLQLLGLAVKIGGVGYPLWAWYQKRRSGGKWMPSSWFWPSGAVFITAVLIQLVQIMRGFRFSREATWLPLGELKDYFFYLFLLIYLGSLFYRLAHHQKNLTGYRTSPERDALAAKPSSPAAA